MSFNSMIQQMDRIGKRSGTSVFILFTLKWTKIKDPTEIEKHTNGTLSSISANIQLSNNNCSKLLSKTRLLNQVVNTDNDLSKSKSIVRSKADINFDKGADFFLNALTINAKQDCFRKKKEKQASQIDAAKHTKLPNKIFDYIYIAWYQRLISLA